jgi:antitoxin ChpS
VALHIAKLRQVGGSVMLAIPPAFLDQMALSAKTLVGIAIENGRLVVERAKTRPKYTLAELIAQCDSGAPLPASDPEWTAGGAVGEELL